jgi:hypothetical protein
MDRDTILLILGVGALASVIAHQIGWYRGIAYAQGRTVGTGFTHVDPVVFELAKGGAARCSVDQLQAIGIVRYSEAYWPGLVAYCGADAKAREWLG